MVIGKRTWIESVLGVAGADSRRAAKGVYTSAMFRARLDEVALRSTWGGVRRPSRGRGFGAWFASRLMNFSRHMERDLVMQRALASGLRRAQGR